MNTRVLEQRPVGALGRIGVVAALHVAVIYLVATGLGVVPKLDLVENIKTRIIDEPRVPDEVPPPVEPPKYVRQDLTVPPPDVPPIEFESSPDVIRGVVAEDPPLVTPVDPTPAVLRSVRLDGRHPLTQPPYPPASVRAGQEGVVELEIYVLPNGRVGDARVVKSTGYDLLDQSAIDEAKRRWRLLPATRDGEPYAQWHRLRVVFELRNR